REELKKYIIYEDDEIIAMDKPAGMLSQKAAASDISINELLVAYLKKDMLFLPGISNRLDRNTSGIILAGKNPMASKLLNIAIRERYLTKKYLCLVKGELTLKGSFEAFLVKDNDTNQVSVSESGAENDRIITGIKPLAYNGRSTLTEIDLITGKPHQIRAHLAFLGHPLAGDTKYGDIEYNDYFRRKYKLKWQLLHAYRIEFDEMTDNLNYLNGKHIEAPLHEQFEKILKGENLWQHGIPED
ncbi:MAG: RluA family pseudouridine synthase, partial [Lachnospiraceae bacterium]|nr:RluA family pseudouridine synthase [Lachnospiraceae bacterium]